MARGEGGGVRLKCGSNLLVSCSTINTHQLSSEQRNKRSQKLFSVTELEYILLCSCRIMKAESSLLLLATRTPLAKAYIFARIDLVYKDNLYRRTMFCQSLGWSLYPSFTAYT